MAMNLVKLQDDLKNAPDQALVGYVQNPTGQVPTYLALSELERRKRMRQGAQAQQGGGEEQPSVAEQLVAESAPPPMEGVASLPVPDDMYSAAQGGIVGYADGGMVAFDNGGLVLSPEEYARLTPAQKVQYDQAQRVKAIRGTGAKVGESLSAPFKWLGDKASIISQGAKQTPVYGFGSATRGLQDETGIAPLVEQQPSRPEQENVTLPDGSVVNKAAFLRSQQGIATGEVAAPPAPPVAQPQPRATGPGITGIAGLPEWVTPELKQYDTAPYEALRGEKPTQEGVMSLMEAERARRGIAEDPYAPLIKDIEAEKGTLTNDFQQDLWLRLAEFGATLASTPGSFGAAVGEAGAKVLPNVMADKKEYKKIERELNKEVKNMALAREGMLEARMKGDMDKFSKDEERYIQGQTKVLDIANKNTDLFNAATVKGAEKSFESKMEGFKESQATGRTAMQVAAQDRATSETRKQAVARGMLETAMKPILAGLKAQMIDDETAYAQAFDQALRKLPKDMQIVLGYTPQERDTGSTMRFDAKGNPI